MVYCQQCGKEIPDNSRYCEFCGAQQRWLALSLPLTGAGLCRLQGRGW
jgi:zinc-ribbon domain